MVVHIALFRWKDGISASEIERSLAEVRALMHKVRGVRHIYCGENYSRWAKGFTHGVVVLAETHEALDAYRKHPDHEVVAKRIDAIEAASIGVDFKD